MTGGTCVECIPAGMQSDRGDGRGWVGGPRYTDPEIDDCVTGRRRHNESRRRGLPLLREKLSEATPFARATPPFRLHARAKGGTLSRGAGEEGGWERERAMQHSRSFSGAICESSRRRGTGTRKYKAENVEIPIYRTAARAVTDRSVSDRGAFNKKLDCS